MVNFYRDLYPKRAATLAPLTDLVGKNKKFIWTEVQNEAFLKMKEIMSRETMLTYPKFDQPFIIYTDASEKQIGGIVTQDGKPLRYYSKKLTETQQRYPVTEQELLAIVETLKYFRYMLLGHRIIIKTDHKNLTHPLSTHTSNRVLRQRLLLEEYGADLEYVPGNNNVVADALSRLPIMGETADTASAEINALVSDNVAESETERTATAKMTDLVGLLSRLPTEELFVFNENDFPLNFSIIAEEQAIDSQLQAELKSQSTKYIKETRDGVPLYVTRDHANIYIPASLRFSILEWYHTTLQHPGIARMQATIKESLYWPGLDAAVEKMVKKCQVCQQFKITAVRKYGKIPLPRNNSILPWEEVHVDLIGPWPVQYASPRNPSHTTIQKIQALTIVDKATGWPEFVGTIVH
jgi:hypothetical protein